MIAELATKSSLGTLRWRICIACVLLGGCFSGGEVANEDNQEDAGAIVGEDTPQSCLDATGCDEDADAACQPPADAPQARLANPCTVGVGACENSGSWICSDGQTLECDATPGEPEQEVCDGVDNDCNGIVDDDPIDQQWYADADGDGYGDPNDALQACDRPEGYVDNPDDCDDTDPDAFVEVVGYKDEDGDGWTVDGPETICTAGSLPDGFVDVQNGEDCDDNDPDIHPGAVEVCDGVDNNCDGRVDKDAVDPVTWYVDCDGDGFPADTIGAIEACDKPADPPSGCSHPNSDWTDLRPSGASTTDCNDDNSDAFPGQTDWFTHPMTGGDFNDQWDYDCSGQVERQFTKTDGSCTTACSGSSGWDNSFAPSCGQSGDYINCSGIFNCDPSPNTRTQGCR